MASDLATIAVKLGFSYRWLVTGEGDPEGEDAPIPATAASTPESTAPAEEIVRLRGEMDELKAKYTALLEETAAERLEHLKLQREVAQGRYLGYAPGTVEEEGKSEVREPIGGYCNGTVVQEPKGKYQVK